MERKEGKKEESKKIEEEKGDKLDPEEEKLMEEDIKLINKLEYFCAGAAFTEPINEFISKNAEHFEPIEEEKGHPHTYFIKYKEYTKLIETMLGKFLEENKVSSERLYECCLRVQEIDPEYLSCLDYILATTEYEEFFELMIDHKAMMNWDYASSAKDPSFETIIDIKTKKQSYSFKKVELPSQKLSSSHILLTSMYLLLLIKMKSY